MMAENKQGAMDKRSIFQDVFRRADKNDDGALSWEEFKSFFNDGVSSDEDLKRLFMEIDTHNTDNLDVGELCEFFTKHLGPFSDIFDNLETIGTSVTRTLRSCHEKYSSSSETEKFATRFLLREVLRMFGFIQHHLETASESIDDDERKIRPAAPAVDDQPQSTTKQRRAMRRMASYQQQTSFQGTSGLVLENEVNRLSELINKLELLGKFEDTVSLNVVEEEIAEKNDLLELVCHKFEVDGSKSEEFKSILREYVSGTKKNVSCLGLSVRMSAESKCFAVFEIWQSKIELSKHLVSDASKTLQRSAIDCLVQPEDFTKFQLPRKFIQAVNALQISDQKSYLHEALFKSRNEFCESGILGNYTVWADIGFSISNQAES